MPGGARPAGPHLASHARAIDREADRDLSSIGGVLDRVLHQVRDNLADAVRVGRNRRQAPRLLDTDADVARLQGGTGQGQRASDHLAQADLSQGLLTGARIVASQGVKRVH